MGNIQRFLGGFAVIALSASAAVSADLQPTVQPVQKLAQPGCADPLADVQVQLLNKTSPTEGRVRISGIIRNGGSLPWVSTSYSHRLRATLTITTSGSNVGGRPVGYPLEIQVLPVGAQQLVTYEMNYTARYDAKYPKFVMDFLESGTPDYARTPREKLDCRSDNNRKEISAAEINRLFGNIPPPPPPLAIMSTVSGGGKLIALLRYHMEGISSAKISATIELPHTGSAPEMTVQGTSGNIPVGVAVNCSAQKDATGESARITYTLQSYLGLGSAGSTWLPIGQTSQQLPLNQVCAGPPPTGNPSASGGTAAPIRKRF